MRAVISAEDEGARRFAAEKTVVVRNSPLLREFATPGSSLAARSNVLVYVGIITRQRGAVEMVDLIGRLDPALGARLVLVGRFGEPDLEAELRTMPGWARVDYRGEQDRTGVQAALGEAVAGLVLWHPTRKHAEGAMPVKLLEYMAAGLPVLASDLPLLHEVVTGADAGVLVDPFDVGAAAEAATRLLQDRGCAIAFGTRGREEVLANRTWSREEPTLLDLYEDVLADFVVSHA
jgi:glycosyltransferase involved in cell wall biosynthesis